MGDAAGRVLVIKLGALGDIVQALGPFSAIRRHHPDSHVTLLTTAPYEAFLGGSGLFEEVWLDDRPKPWQPRRCLALRSRLRSGGFARVYDLQTSGRSSSYFRLFWPGPVPEWSGIASGCSHPHANPSRDSMHTLERQAEQLRDAGIDHVSPPDLAWAKPDLGRFKLPERYALMVPGGAAHRPGKRWPTERYGELARRLAAAGILPVLIGTSTERNALDAIAETCPEARSLAGQTDFLDIVGLARGALAAVGNDTGPMHLIAVAGCPCVVLYSNESDPALCGQRGPAVRILRRPTLAQLTVDEVATALAAAEGNGDVTTGVEEDANRMSA